VTLLRRERKYVRRETLAWSQGKTLPIALKGVAGRIEANRTTSPYAELL
jgi:hypothetical protein